MIQPYTPDVSLAGKLRRRFARLVHRRPARLSLTRPIVSFSFDDIPATAANAGAQALERQGVRGTFYVCAGLFGQEGHMGRFADAAEIDAPGPDAGVIDAAVIDAAMVDAATVDAMIDAMVDAATDAAQVIDAGADALLGPDAGVPMDATYDAFIPPDSALPADAGADALIPPDSSLPVDAGADAPIIPLDANNNPACKAPGCPDAQI